jgi:hypothetical protein
MRRRIEIEADDRPQFAGEVGIIGLTHPVRLRAVADAALPGHRCGRPVGGLARWTAERERDDTLLVLGAQARDA